jgi:hypothetical protein
MYPHNLVNNASFYHSYSCFQEGAHPTRRTRKMNDKNIEKHTIWSQKLCGGNQRRQSGMDSLQSWASERRYSFTLAAVALIVLTASIATLVPGYMMTIPWPTLHVKQHFSCGETARNAQASGCVFDIMSRFWVPHDCFYPEIDEQFRQEHASSYFSDELGQHQIDITDMAQYSGNVFTSFSYHFLHCKYLLRRNHLAVATGGKLPAAMTSLYHTEHCIDVLASKHSANVSQLIKIFDTGFPRCVSPREALGLGHSDDGED